MRQIFIIIISLIASCSGQCTEWGWNYLDKNDIVGEDIISVPSPHRDGCQLPCFQTARCVAYSWFNGICYLKRGKTTITSNDDVYSAVICKEQPCTHWGWRFYDFTDIKGNVITQILADHRNDCQGQCQTTSGCVAYSWTNGLCDLMDSIGQFVDTDDVYSAIMCKATTTCDDEKIRGVNLGGWLLLEQWMTPSLFGELNEHTSGGSASDEWTVAQFVDKNFAKERLERHWDTFYQKNELLELWNSGISHLRIPVGFWLVDVKEGEPFPPPPASDDEGQRFYLKRLMKWADEIGLKVLLDLHGAPGSQNGMDHSGHSGTVDWLNNGNVERTLDVISKLSSLMEKWINEGAIKAETLYGIELLNEPADSVWDKCKNSFYPDSYRKVREYFLSLPEDKRPWVNLMTGFKPSSDFYGYMPEPEFRRVSLDAHLYQCFGDYWNEVAGKPEGWSTHLEHSCRYHSEVGGMTLATFTGEFSLSVVDCRVASQSTCEYYHRPFSAYPEDYKEFLRNYFLAQIDAFEFGPTGVGWFFWNAKIDYEDNGGAPWNYLFLLRNGIVPSDLCNRKTYCSF